MFVRRVIQHIAIQKHFHGDLPIKRKSRPKGCQRGLLGRFVLPPSLRNNRRYKKGWAGEPSVSKGDF